MWKFGRQQKCIVKQGMGELMGKVVKVTILSDMLGQDVLPLINILTEMWNSDEQHVSPHYSHSL